MSTCDCDRKNSNGGTCDSSCNETVQSFMTVENNSSSASFAPVLAMTKAAGAFEVFSCEGSCALCA